MNKKALIAAGLVIALVVLGAFVFSNKKQTVTQNEMPLADNQTKEGTNASLKELFTSGTSQSCTFNSNTAGNGSGTVYMTTGHMRGDFNVSYNDMTTSTHMISDGTTSYIWIDGQPNGFKMAFDSQGQQSNTPNEKAIDMEQKIDYRCSNWTPDQTMFVPPSTVTFSDMTAVKNTTSVKGEENADMKVQQCAACDSAPEPAQAQCKAALGCN